MMDGEKGTYQPDSLERKPGAMTKMEPPAEKINTQPEEEEAAQGKNKKGTAANQKKKTNMETTNMHQRRYRRSKQNMPTNTTNREDGRKYEKRARATTWTHSMCRHRTNRIQSANRQIGMPIRRLPTNHG